jgi:hypothetical protein
MAFCSKCKDSLSHRIARGKETTDAFRQYEIVEKISEEKYKCLCKRCGNEWVSRSKVVAEDFKKLVT